MQNRKLLTSFKISGSLTLAFLSLMALPLLTQAQAPLRIAAAADLQPVLPPILTEFEKSTGIHTEATYQALRRASPPRSPTEHPSTSFFLPTSAIPSA